MPSEPEPDAGERATVSTAAPAYSALSAMRAWRGRGAHDAKLARAPSPPDPRVDKCTRTATDKASLMACFAAIATPSAESAASPDAGHKLGAVRPPIVNPSWAVPDWYVNASTGSDSNTCVTSGAPCKTLAEIMGRWGTTDPVITSVTITIQTSLPSTDPFRSHPTTAPGGSGLTIQGTVATVGTGTLAGVVPKNRPAGQELEADLGASAATFVGQRICNAPRASCAKASKIISGHVARISQPVASDNTTEVDTWVNGDAFTVSSMPAIYVDDVSAITFNNATLTASGFNVIYTSFSLIEDSALGAATVLVGRNQTAVANSTDEAAFSGGGGFFLTDGSLSSGVAHFPVLYGGSSIDSDVIVSLEAELYSGPNAMGYGSVFLDTGTYVHTSGHILPGGVSGLWYGNGYQINSDFSIIEYNSAASSFLGSGNTLSIVNTAFGTSCDTSRTPEPCTSGVPLSVANLDTPYPTGFGGWAKADTGPYGFRKFGIVAVSPTPYVTPVTNGGTGLSSLCGSGQGPISNGSSYVCTTPSGGTASCPINLATCVSGQLPVANGGTAASTLPANNLLVGNGTSAVTGLAPGTNGNVATSNGSTWTSAPNTSASCPINLASCVAGTLPVASGGTGGNNCSSAGVLQGQGTSPMLCTVLAAHSAVIGENTSALATAAPGAAGQGLLSNGSTSDPSFQTNVPGGAAGGDLGGAYPNPNVFKIAGRSVPISTGLLALNSSSAWSPLAPGAAGNVATSNGTDWTSAAPTNAGPSNAIDVTGVDFSASNASVQVIGSTTLTTPAGFIMVQEGVIIRNNGAGGLGSPLNTSPQFGYSIDSAVGYAQSRTVSVGFAGITSTFSDSGFEIDGRTSVSAGTHTIRVLANSNNSYGAGTLTISATANPFYLVN